MSDGDDSNLLALPPVVAERSIPALEDVRDYFDPDAVWVIGPDREPKAAARARQVFGADGPVVHPPLGDAGPVQRHDLGTLSVVTVRRGAVLEEAGETLAAARGREDGTPTVLVCDDVTTTVRPTALETTLEFAPALASLAADADQKRLTVLTGGLPATYDRTWHLERSSGACLGVGSPDPESESEPDDTVAVRVHGLGSVDGYGPARSISRLALSSDGSTDRPPGLTIDVETLDADKFGLEAVTGVGPKTAERLEKRGTTTRSELLETPVAQLCDLPNVGPAGAERMHAHAEVLETGEPRRLTDEALPGESHRPPLCLDIETDGLSPTIVWQVGVYDPIADSYRAFVERTDPADPGPVIESFCDWLLGTHPDRALCTWNGWRFDYRHLGAFVNRHAPHYASEWEAIPKFDLYGWATDGNALLPGRTNKLEDVSSALDYEGSETGLDGAATAAAYQRFMRTGAELEWDRHEAYCEDDCRALWHVYERVREAPRVSGSGSKSGSGSASRAGSGGRDETEGTRTSGESEQVGLDSF